MIEFYGTSQTSQTAISENQWHHVAVVCNAGQVTYYLDGVADGTATGGTGFNADNMGDDPGSETFKGGVDEVRVYNGALSAAQVAALASSGTNSLSATAVYDSGSTVTSASVAVTVTGKKQPHLGISMQQPGTGLSLAIQPSSQLVLQVTAGDPAQVYSIQTSPDLTNWTVTGIVTLDATGYCQVTNTVPVGAATAFYRLQPQ